MNTRRAHDRVELHCGDMLAVLPSLSADSIDACVTDPPYHLNSIVKRFGQMGPNDKKLTMGRIDPYQRTATGFMNQKWDGGDIAFRPETWAEVFRVLKPGAHLLAFGGTRTSHRMACAIEDAGFEIRDTILWLYGSGFPKSHDVSKGIDRAAGAKGQFGDKKLNVHSRGNHVLHEGWHRPWMDDPEAVNNSGREYLPATNAASQWEGWGTALKPACEPIILARKPLAEDTIAANVLKWGTGAINIDGCRIAGEARAFGNGTARSGGIMGESEPRGRWESPSVQRRKGAINHLSDRPAQETEAEGRMMSRQSPEAYRAERPGETLGRWPANVIHDGSEEVTAAFPDADARNGGTTNGHLDKDDGWGMGAAVNPTYRDSGSAARFFYTAKADDDDRLGSKHPTVKPLDLVQYLVRLVTPRDGLVLDPFAGTGTTAEAAFREGMRCVLIEREAQYCADIRRRMANVLSGPDERAREAIKQKLKDKPIDSGPLFGGT